MNTEFVKCSGLKPVRILLDEHLGFYHMGCIKEGLGDEVVIDRVVDCIPSGSSDPEVYKYACVDRYDLIISCDAKIMYDDDLCTVVNRLFIAEEVSRVPVVIVSDSRKLDFKTSIELYREEILSLARDKNFAVLDTRPVSEARNITGTNDPVIFEFVPVMELYKRGELRNANKNVVQKNEVEASSSKKNFEPGGWLQNYIEGNKGKIVSNTRDTKQDPARGKWLRDYEKGLIKPKP